MSFLLAYSLTYVHILKGIPMASLAWGPARSIASSRFVEGAKRV